MTTVKMTEDEEATKAHILETAQQLLEALDEFEGYWNLETNRFQIVDGAHGLEDTVFNAYPVREFLVHLLDSQKEDPEED